MMGRTHLASGVAAWLAVSPAVDAAVGLSTGQVAAGAALCAGAAMAPDLDMPRSSIGRVYGPVSYGLAWIIARLSGGHRGGTHSLLGIAAATALAWWAAGVGGAFVWLLVWLLLGVAIRGSTRSMWVVVRMFTMAVVTTVVLAADLAVAEVLPYAVAVGAAAHVAGDCLTDRGCPLLWPYRRRFGMPLVTTKGWFEPLIRWGCIGATVALVVT